MRIGVNVPNELLQRVKQIKPAINVSQVCRETLEHCVSIHKRAVNQPATDSVYTQVERLARSAANPLIEPDWVTYGLEDARDWVKTITPERWGFFNYQSDYLRRNGRDEFEMVDLWSSEGDVKGFNHRLADHKEWLLQRHERDYELGIGSNPREEALREYARAWLGYVHEVRRMIEKHHKDEYDKVMAEREAYRKALPNPELPEKLV